MTAQTVKARLRHEIEPVKGSRFIVTIAPVASEEEARALAVSVASEMPDASHHCTAWRIAKPAIERCSDDGEPAGSAGRPILSQLAGRNLVNVAIVVTRYFGGTKLGVGGLVRAYGSAAGAAVDHSTLTIYETLTTATVLADYGDVDRVQQVIASHGGVITASAYDTSVTLTIATAETRLDELAAALANISAGRARLLSP